MRIKTQWHKKDKPKSLEELASVLGFVTWRAAQERADKMYNAGFNFSSQAQLLDVVGEFVVFLLQLADRLCYERLPDEQRRQLMGALAQHLVRTLVDNMTTVSGPGDHRAVVVARLNERMEAYAEFGFADGQPSYQSLRYLGQCVDGVMGGTENKWVIEQVVDIEAPEAIKNLKKGLNDILSQWEAAPAA